MQKMMTDADYWENEIDGIMFGESFVILLKTQYRMHPSIAAWPNEKFYNGKIMEGFFFLLKDRPPVPGITMPGEGIQYIFCAVEGQAKSVGNFILIANKPFRYCHLQRRF